MSRDRAPLRPARASDRSTGFVAGGSSLARRTQQSADHAQATELDAAVKGARLPPPDISSYVRPAGLMETRYVRLLSSLCAQTYYLSKMTVRRYCNGLNLPPSSPDRTRQLGESPRADLSMV